MQSLAQLNAGEAQRLREAKSLLERRLSSEIASDQLAVGFDERGLVVRVMDRILFDSGFAELRPEAFSLLDKVATVLNEDLGGQPVGIEGHTDNAPIQQSNWKDNWDLSLARARSVLAYLVHERGLDPNRVTASGYGEYRPIASNDTLDGRQQNRRVEVVVLPRPGGSQADTSEAGPSGLYTK